MSKKDKMKETEALAAPETLPENAEITEETKQEAQEILDLVEERKQARANKDWSKSDELRDLIQSKGYEIKDSKNGTEVKRK